MSRKFFSWLLYIACFSCAQQVCAEQLIEFCVVIPSYNNEKYVQGNIQSVAMQSYKNWTIYYIDDCSSDKTWQLVNQEVKAHNIEDKCILVHNEKRRHSLANVYTAVHNLTPKKIVVILDGDDEFSSSDVLQTLADAYSDPTTWMTYGNFRCSPYLSYLKNLCAPIPPYVAKENSFRTYRWIFGPLRTFYAQLFQKIKKEDLMHGNDFYHMAGDQAFMYPMAEMAGGKHIRYISQVLYVYHVDSPINDFRINSHLADKLAKEIRARPPYQPLEKMF